MNNHTEYIISALNKIADINKSAWWNNYLRNEIEFIGVGMPDNRNIILNWHKKKHLAVSECIDVCHELMSQDIAEYKLAAILLYQYVIQTKITNADLIKNINDYFEKGYIFDWNTCDWFCVRLITPIIETGNKDEINTILNWYQKENYWQARAALVPFAQCKNLKNFLPDLIYPMNNLIRLPQRFAKTSVGWLLRQISKFDKNYVLEFLENNRSYLTKEVINNALKYSDKTEREQYYD